MNNCIHLKNIREVLTLDLAYEKDGRNLNPEDLAIIQNTSIIHDNNEILYIGSEEKVPHNFKPMKTFDLSELCITPEIVDSHTHLVFAGNRAEEYSMRLNGKNYEEIAKAGGGILSTMNAVNKASNEDLYQLGIERIEEIYKYGIGTIEIKSGYGLNLKKEIEVSKVIDRLKKYFSPRIQIKNTFMAAHAVPKNFSNSKEYIDKVVIPALKSLAPLEIIDAVDIFHEKNYFDGNDVNVLFNEAKRLNIPVKIHADEFYDNDGASFAVDYDALSADHLLSINKKNISKIANSDTVATLLPGTGLFLGKKQADGRALLDQGAKVNIASDYNPGSCHYNNLLQIASIAAPMYQMNMCELWAAITLNAAHALGLKNQGAIRKGMKPRFSYFKTNSISDITYSWGKNLATWPEDIN